MEISLKNIGDLSRAIAAKQRSMTRTDWDSGEQFAYEIALAEINNRFAHFHAAGPDDMCAHCGLHLYDDIHKRQL